MAEIKIKTFPFFCCHIGHVEKLLKKAYEQAGRTREANATNLHLDAITTEDLLILGIKKSAAEILQGQYWDENHIIDQNHNGKLELHKFATALEWGIVTSSKIEEFFPKILAEETPGDHSAVSREEVSSFPSKKPSLNDMPLQIPLKGATRNNSPVSIPPIKITIAGELFENYGISPEILKPIYGENEINLQIQVLQLSEEHSNILDEDLGVKLFCKRIADFKSSRGSTLKSNHINELAAIKSALEIAAIKSALEIKENLNLPLIIIRKSPDKPTNIIRLAHEFIHATTPEKYAVTNLEEYLKSNEEKRAFIASFILFRFSCPTSTLFDYLRAESGLKITDSAIELQMQDNPDLQFAKNIWESIGKGELTENNIAETTKSVIQKICKNQLLNG